MYKKVEKVKPTTLPPKGNVTSRTTKYHPKTLVIPITTTSTSTSTVPSTKKMIFANGNGNRAGDKRSSGASPVPAHNKITTQSPRRGRVPQKPQQTQKSFQVPANSTSSSSGSFSTSSTGAINPTQLASICREVALIRDEHVAIRNTLSEKEGELGQTRMALENLAEERDQLRNKVSELEQILKNSPQMHSHVAGLLSSREGGLVTNQNHPPIMSTMENSSSTTFIIPSNNHIPHETGNSISENAFHRNQKLTGSRSWPENVTFHSSPYDSNQWKRDSADGKLHKVWEAPSSVPLASFHPSSLPNVNFEESDLVNNGSSKVREGEHHHSKHNYKIISGNNSRQSNQHYHHHQLQSTGEVFISPSSHEQERNGSWRGGNEKSEDLFRATTTEGNDNNSQFRNATPSARGGILGQLAQPWAIHSSVREIEHRMVVQGIPPEDESVREVEIEIDRLNSRIDHLRSQNDVLTLNLEDAKGHADRLTELLGKYESNNVALQMALRYSDQVTDAYEVLVALLETEMGQVLANLHARGQLNAICSPPSHNNNNTSTGTPPLTTSTTVSRSSGNNNNSNGNSPSEQVPPVQVTDETNQEINGSAANSGSDNCFVGSNKSQDNISQVETPTTVTSIPEKVSPSGPSSSGVFSSAPSPKLKSMDLIEQAGRNRLVAERAARFVLSRFSPTTSFPSNGMMYPARKHSSSFSSRQNSQSESSCNSTRTMLSSSPSATSNLSNISRESGHQPVGEAKAPSSISTDITTMVVMVSTSTSNGGSPTTSATSSTFRAHSSQSSPFSPNGNELLSGNHSSSVIPSLLPFVGNTVSSEIQNNSSKDSIPNYSDDQYQSQPTSIEPQIRNLISTLKVERDGVKRTVVQLESESLESLTPSPKPFGHQHSNNGNNNSSTTWSTSVEGSKLDLETAVLMQELMAMKEERAELRAQVFLLEKEKDSLELRVRSHESQEEAYMARINYLKAEIMDCKGLYSATEMTLDTFQHPDNRNRNEMLIHTQQQQQQQRNNGSNRNLKTITTQNNNNNQNGNWEREAILKKRIHELASALERVAMGSQLQERENEEMINELNRANGILMQTLEASKKKYQNRIRKMEDQILYVSERHAAQMKLFGGMGNGTVIRSPGMGNYHR